MALLSKIPQDFNSKQDFNPLAGKSDCFYKSPWSVRANNLNNGYIYLFCDTTDFPAQESLHFAQASGKRKIMG